MSITDSIEKSRFHIAPICRAVFGLNDYNGEEKRTNLLVGLGRSHKFTVTHDSSSPIMLQLCSIDQSNCRIVVKTNLQPPPPVDRLMDL